MGVKLERRLPVSCFIIARNEAHRIGRVIEAVSGWVDEVVVVDSGSSDGTQDRAARLGARVIDNVWAGYGPQKRFAEEQCRNDWLLNLDADEVPTDDLCREIVDLFAGGPPSHPFFSFRLSLVYPGRARPRPWVRDHLQIRLYNRRAGRFSESPVHDTVQSGGVRPIALRGDAWHYSYPALGFLVAKLNAYTDMQVRAAPVRDRRVLLARLPFEFPMTFLKYYILRCHFTGGANGFSFSMTSAFARVLRVMKLLERRTGQSDI